MALRSTPAGSHCGGRCGSFRVGSPRRHNRQRRTFGPSWQGRYKTIVVADERYLRQLLAHIHLNPVVAGAASDPARYRWSGHRELLGRVGQPLVDAEAALVLFGARREVARSAYVRALRGERREVWIGKRWPGVGENEALTRARELVTLVGSGGVPATSERPGGGDGDERRKREPDADARHRAAAGGEGISPTPVGPRGAPGRGRGQGVTQEGEMVIPGTEWERHAIELARLHVVSRDWSTLTCHRRVAVKWTKVPKRQSDWVGPRRLQCSTSARTD